MIRVVILGSWSDCVGTDYCDVLGWYPMLKDAEHDAWYYANDNWDPQDDYGDDWEPEGPDYTIEEYVPEKHDMLKAGGGSFEPEFERMKP